MKKSLIALAVLGSFAGAAAAQSTATLYGLIDVGYGVGNNGRYEGSSGRQSKFQQWGNSNSTSRWGLKGSEDLGNGTKVYFELEQGFNPESGKDKGGFDRSAFVGISGSFGAIQAGRQKHIMNRVLGQFDVSGSPNLTSSLGNAGISAISENGGGEKGTYSRVDSALAYVSPNFSGFQVQGAFILKNDQIAGANSKNIYTIGATYNYGGFTIGAAYESKLADGMSASWGLGLKYDFGSFLISGGYLDNHYRDDGKGFYLGFSVPIDAFELGAQVAYNTKAYDGEKDVYYWGYTGPWGGNIFDINNYGFIEGKEDKKVKPLAIELYGKYKLSKRSQMYMQAGWINADAKEYQGAKRKYSASIGLVHSF